MRGISMQRDCNYSFISVLFNKVISYFTQNSLIYKLAFYLFNHNEIILLNMKLNRQLVAVNHCLNELNHSVK